MNTNLQVVPKQSDERIGQYAQRLMVEHPELKNHEILMMVKDQFKDGNTQMASIAWYKSDLKRKGVQATPAPKEEEVERTTDVVQDELDQAQAKVEELKKELEDIKKKEEDDLLARAEQIEEEMKRLNNLKKARAKAEETK